MALEWGDVDLVAGLLTVRRSSWKGVIGTPKRGRERKVPLTGRLRLALKTIKHLKSDLVLCHRDDPCGARRRCRLRSSGPSCGSVRNRDSACGEARRRDDGFEPSTMQPVVQPGASLGHDGSDPSSLRFGAEREWGGASSDFAEREG